MAGVACGYRRAAGYGDPGYLSIAKIHNAAEPLPVGGEFRGRQSGVCLKWQDSTVEIIGQCSPKRVFEDCTTPSLGQQSYAHLNLKYGNCSRPQRFRRLSIEPGNNNRVGL